MNPAEPSHPAAYLRDDLDEEGLAALARTVAVLLEPGDVVVLRGEVGAGKTTFVREAAGSLGVREAVTSPTYQLARRYRGHLPGRSPGRSPGQAPGEAGRVVLVNHLDLYRLEGLDPWDALDPDEYVTDEAVTFIEWAGPALALLPTQPSVVEISHQTPSTRRVRLSGPLAARLFARED